MQYQSSGMEQSTTEAKSYAESITILNSTENKAPELVYEEDEMDEDGDIDDDLNLFCVCYNNKNKIHILNTYSFAFDVDARMN